VPFNQRLLSSTPAASPKRKRLVEHQGVLLLNGSTETQILNSTDTAAAVRPLSSPRPSGPCLSRGDVQFAAAVHCSSSSSSVASSTGSCDVDVAPAAGANARPLYSLASSGSVPYQGNSAPCYGAVHSSGRQPPSTSQPVIYTAAKNSCHPVSTSLAHDVHHSQLSGMPAPPATSHVHSRFDGVYGTNPTSVGFTDPHIHPLVRPLQARTHQTVPCSCTQPAFQTNIRSAPVRVDHSRPPVTLAASSSQETIEINLDCSPVRSEPREPFTAVRGTTKDRNHRRRSRSGTVRDYQRSENAGSRRPQCRSTADDNDTERLMSLLRHLKVVITANRNPEVTRLLSEVCDAARTAQLLPPLQSVQPTVHDTSPIVERLQSEITQLNRFECSCMPLGI